MRHLGADLSAQITEDTILKNIEAAMIQHPLLAQTGIDTKTLAENPWFKSAMKWLPYLPVVFFVLKFLSQQQNVFMLRRIEKQLQRLEK